MAIIIENITKPFRNQEGVINEKELSADLMESMHSLWIHIPMVLIIIMSIIALLLNALGCTGACVLSYSLLSGKEYFQRHRELIKVQQGSSSSHWLSSYSVYPWLSGYSWARLITLSLPATWQRRYPSITRQGEYSTWSLIQFRETCSVVVSCLHPSGQTYSLPVVVRISVLSSIVRIRSVSWRTFTSTPARNSSSKDGRGSVS